MVEFIGRYNRNWCKLVSLMLLIQLVAHLSNPTLNRFFIRIGPPRKKCRVLLGENLRLFVSPWWPLQGIFPMQGSSGIQTTRMLSLFFSMLAGNWICRCKLFKPFRFAWSIAFLFMLDGSLGILMSEPTPSASLLILMITLLMIFFRVQY